LSARLEPTKERNALNGQREVYRDGCSQGSDLNRGSKFLWQAQQRLHERYRKFLAKSKNKAVVLIAVGRELLGFIWAIGIQAETAQKESLQRPA
jgi:hypothetical protein